MNIRRRRTALAAALAAAVLLGVTACGAGEHKSATTAASSGDTTQVVAADQAAIAAVEKPVADWTGPTSPTKAVAGKKIWIISCSQASNCSIDTSAAAEAAQAIGWTATVFDGQGDPARYSQGIRNAVADGAAGIILISVPTGLVTDALRFASQHHVQVVNAASQDTSDTQTDDPAIFANVVHPWADQGTWLGQWLVADSKGTAQVVIFRDDEFSGVQLRQDMVAAQLAKCSGCAVLDQNKLSISDATSSRMTEITKAEIDRFGSKLKYIVSPYGTVEAFIIPAIKAAGRTDIKVVGYDGNKQQSSFCNEGSVGAIAVTLLGWTGWAGVDQMNRAFNNQPAVNENVKGFLATHDGGSCPNDQLAESLVKYDYKSKFKQLWGVS
jgi:ribose transport system substrate-binding protein